MKLSIMRPIAGIAQLVEHNLAKVGVASSSLVSRSKIQKSLSRKIKAFFISFNNFIYTKLLALVKF